MTTLTNRAVKGSRLTTTEGDNNWKRQAQAKTTTYSVVVGDNRDTIECSGTFTVTLPDAASIVSSANTGDFRVNLVNSGSGTITVARTTGTDTINGTAANITLLPGECAPLKVNQAGNGYNLDSGTNVLLGLTASVTELNRSDITTEGTVEASKVVTADSSGYITHDASSVEKRMYWNGSSKQSYFYALPNGDFGYFDQQNTRIIWNYDESDNEVDFVSGINASGGVTGDLTGDVVASAITSDTVTATTTNGDLGLSGNGTGYTRASGGPSGTIQGIYVGLDTPEQLVNGDFTTSSWTTVNSSTLATAQAKAAKLRVKILGTGTSTSLRVEGYVRQTGSGLGTTDLTNIIYSRNASSSSVAMGVGYAVDVTVNLDGSYDFDWYAVGFSTTIVTTDIVLVGYYV